MSANVPATTTGSPSRSPSTIATWVASRAPVTTRRGSTARALCDEPDLKRLDIADTSPDIVELSRLPFPDPARDPLRDPRVRLHLEDGRFFLRTTDQRFDLITSEPPPPIGAGVVNLYTQEYFELIRERLNEGGLCTYWLPVYSIQEPGSRAIVKVV